MCSARRAVRDAIPAVAVAVGSVGAATLAIAVLEDAAAVPNASSVYLIAVVVTAIVARTVGAVVAASTSVLAYNFLFTEPRHTFTVADPGDWLNLLVLLFVGIAVGQLAALQRRRAEMAVAREREARAMFQVTRALATRASTADVLPAIASSLREHAEMDRIWIALGDDEAGERVAVDVGAGPAARAPARFATLQRMPGDTPARWIGVHAGSSGRVALGREAAAYRTRIEAGGQAFGAIWAVRPRSAGEPDRTATRLLAAAADQIGQAIVQDRLAEEARDADVARRGDRLKSALLESVSHDLRTPLASIRAAAGSLMDPTVHLAREEVQASAASIDRDAERLNRLVANLLDLGRIEGGALRAEREIVELDDFVRRAVERVGERVGEAQVAIDADHAPPVAVDPVLLEEVLLNVVDNALRHTPAGTPIRVSARELPSDAVVRLTVEDAGPGVPDDALPHLFERFYRVRGRRPGSRHGTGIGLAVVRGLTTAMGGRVAARPSELGGLAVDVDLPLARLPAELAAE